MLFRHSTAIQVLLSHQIGKMAVASRYSSLVLSRTVAPRISLGMPSRAFSTSLTLRDDYPRRRPNNAPEPVARSNPLIGNYVPRPSPAPGVRADEVPPVSTERPRGTRPPRVSRPPASSAEVPPNTAMPPPPPPLASETSAMDALASKLGNKPQAHAYDAAKPGAAVPGIPKIDIASIISGRSAEYGRSGSPDDLVRPKLRTKAVLGRTVFVKDHYSLTTATSPASAFSGLKRLVGVEKIKSKSHQQRFHERKGLKKKRLRSERWRSRFKDGFKATVDRVIELKRQGW